MRRLITSVVAFSLLLTPFVHPKDRSIESKRISKKARVLWRQPSDIRTLNLYYGPGGEAGQPRAPFHFIEEDRDGTNPKFTVKDARGIKWKVKLGEEARPETAATRLGPPVTSQISITIGRISTSQVCRNLAAA